jgi:pilus assembly protein CpaB
MVKNQPIVDGMLAPEGAGSGLQAVIPAGMRAITMEVNEFSGVAGLLTPGCRVDIIATINSGDTGQVSKTIVQNVKVTAVGQRMAAGGNEPPPPPGELFKSVTVLASLQDSEAIELACATGRPRLVLRGGRDNQIVATAGISMGELRAGGAGSGEIIAIAPPPPTTAPATTEPVEAVATYEPPRRVVRVIRGGIETNVTMNVEANAFDGATVDNDMDPFTK